MDRSYNATSTVPKVGPVAEDFTSLEIDLGEMDAVPTSALDVLSWNVALM
jgi:hypothetical protein